MLPPGGGIGEHFHNYCEEMFVILDGEAEYSIDSRTSTLKGPGGAVARLGHSHAITNQFDKPMANFEGGKGTAMYHRGLDPSTFYSTWSYVDHLVLPPGASVGPNTKPDMAEVYYVMSGNGTATIGGETVEIHAGDAVPAALGESRAFAATAAMPLEFMVIGISLDFESKKAYMLSDESRRRTGPR